MSDAGDALAIAMLDQLVRAGALGADDLNDMADRLEAEGDDQAAHWARAALVTATVAGITSDERADDARSRFRVLDGGNGSEG